MQYLIDGHNLIGKMADIRLEDPDDEVALVLRLRRWAAKGSKRQILIYFDRGLPGGQDKGLSTGNVKVVFASSGQSADSLLIRQIQRVKNPGGYTLVSSDNRIRKAAQERHMPLWRAEEFAARMAKDLAPGAATDITAVDDDPLSIDEVEMWLTLFEVDKRMKGGQKKHGREEEST